MERKNGWTLAGQVGQLRPDGVQRLLNLSQWDEDAVRDDVRDFVVGTIGARDGILIGDDTGFLKKGTRSVGVQRQYSGTAGRTENDTVITAGWAEVRVDELTATLPRQAWKRISGGQGSHGERIYDWARVAIQPVWENGFGHWVLARRSVSDPSKTAHHVCYGPVGTRLKDLVKVAAARWAIGESFQAAKMECGLDHYQVRLYRAWYRHITLAMAALAYLTALRAREAAKAHRRRRK